MILRADFLKSGPDQPLMHVPRGPRSQGASGIMLCHLVKIQSLLILQGSIYNKRCSISS